MASDPITSLDVSLGTALLPRPLERNTHGGATTASLAPAGAATESFLWVAREPDVPPVVDVVVLYDDEAAPEGYRKVGRDVSGGAPGGKVYLAFKTATAGDTAALAVVNIAVVGDGGAPRT